jgi:mycothiol S-conjugate amidase
MTIPDFANYGIDSHWINPEPPRRTLLVVYAHPDDESFGNAGTIIHYTAQGAAVHYACATRGESGTVAPEKMRGYADVGALRTDEMLCAAKALDLTGLHFLGYRDSGMVGTPENDHPDALVQADPDRVAGQVTALIRALQPQVVLTFGPYGGYGHPDHIAMHHAATRAFREAADPTCFPEQVASGLGPWQPSKLYYPTFRTLTLKIGIRLMRLRGMDPSRLGENKDIDLVRAAAETTPITTTVNSQEHLVAKERAWACHASQNSARGPFQRLPGVLRSRFFANEHFTRIVPEWHGGPREKDLFRGI